MEEIDDSVNELVNKFKTNRELFNSENDFVCYFYMILFKKIQAKYSIHTEKATDFHFMAKRSVKSLLDKNSINREEAIKMGLNKVQSDQCLIYHIHKSERGQIKSKEIRSKLSPGAYDLVIEDNKGQLIAAFEFKFKNNSTLSVADIYNDSLKLSLVNAPFKYSLIFMEYINPSNPLLNKIKEKEDLLEKYYSNKSIKLIYVKRINDEVFVK